MARLFLQSVGKDSPMAGRPEFLPFPILFPQSAEYSYLDRPAPIKPLPMKSEITKAPIGGTDHHRSRLSSFPSTRASVLAAVAILMLVFPFGASGSAISQGHKTLLFMPVAFSDAPTAPISQSGAYSLMNQVSQVLAEESYNTVAITADVTPLLILPQTRDYYKTQGAAVLATDARVAARTAGFETANYDLEIVDHQFLGPPNFNYLATSLVGSKGMDLQTGALSVVLHELGHNLGLYHANSWTAAGDSDSIIGPGSNVEQGNTFDLMGPDTSTPGVHEIGAENKNTLGWLPLSFVHTVANSGTYRVFAFDVPNLVGAQKYALRVQKDYARWYWAEYRQKFTDNPWTQSGVVLNWSPWNNFVGNSLKGTVLLDTTPGSQSGHNGKDDAPVVIGRTFSDPAAGIHLTPLAKGTASSGNWIDLRVNLGSFPGNLPPVLQIAADPTSVPANTPVNFSAAASDPDGDVLAYDWDYGDLTFGTNSPASTKSWSVVGQYVVRCTVSDMKGGVASRNLVVTVGSPGTFQVSGRVTTSGGQPVEGVRMHNGLSDASYRGAYTDSDGYYTVANLAAGSCTLAAVKYGYALATAGWSNPVSVGADVGGRDWTATLGPVLSVAASDPAAAETGADPGMFTLTRSGSLASALTVQFNLSGTAGYSSDYSLSPTPTVGSAFQLVMPAGVASMNIVLTPLGDLLAEGPETATLTLFEDSAYALGSFAEATVTIADSQSPGTPTVSVTATDNLATESGSDTGVFLFTRSGSLASDLTVNYTATGTATNGLDYSSLSGAVVIPAGQASAVVAFNAVEDVLVEGDESVIVTLQTDAAYNVGTPSSATVTIVDNDQPGVRIFATDDKAVEGSSDTGTFTVARIGNLAANLVVNYALSGTASNGIDYVALSGTVTIPAGQVSASFTVTPLNDSFVEGTETVAATILSNPSYNIGNPGAATVLMIDDDSPGITLAATDASAAEAAANTGTFTFTRSDSTTDPLTIYFSVSGSAINGADYLPVGSSIVIPGGSASAPLTVTPVDDAIKENSETVVITLAPSPTSTYSVTTTTPQTVTISDNDSGGLVGVGFASATSSGLENEFIVSVTVSLSAASSVPVTVNYAFGGGTASNPADYVFDPPQPLYFSPGTVTQSIFVLVKDDTLVEPAETIVITLSDPVNAVLDALTSHTHTILDNDSGGTVSITAGDANASESGLDTGTFRISRTGPATSDLPVSFQVTGTASSPSDHLPLGTSAVIPAGQSYVDLVITPIDDQTPEPMETVVVTLTSAPGAAIGSPSTATVFIADNDESSALPLVSVVASDPNAWETGSDTGTFTISRVGDTTAALAVTYTVSGTATNGSDYASIGTSVTIPAGSAEATITITPIPDAISEADETVVLTLTVDGTFRAAPAASSATVTIHETPPPVTVGFAAAASAGGENVSPAVLLVTLSASQPTQVTVHYAATGGTATGGGVDYTLAPGTLTFAPGETEQSIPITIIDDTRNEADETIIVTLDSPDGATLNANPTHTYTINVNDGTIASYEVSASSPQTAGVAFLTTVTAKNEFGNPVTTDSATVVTMTGTGSVQYDSNGNGTFGDNTKTLSNGTFTISTKDAVVEAVTLTATDGNSKTGSSSSITILTYYGVWIAGYPSLTGADALPGADPDGDGLTNLQEYAFGMNPTNPAIPGITHAGGVLTSTGPPYAVNFAAGTGWDFGAVFCRRVNYASVVLTYTVQFSADNAVWVDSTATPTVLATDAGRVMEAVSVPYPLFIRPGGVVKKAQFFRVGVSMAP